MLYDLLMKNCRIPEGDNMVAVEIAVKDGVIAAILKPDSGAEAAEVLDIGGKLVLPGCIWQHASTLPWAQFGMIACVTLWLKPAGK